MLHVTKQSVPLSHGSVLRVGFFNILSKDLTMAETCFLFCPTSYVVFSYFQYKTNHMSVALYRLTHTHISY